MCPTTPPPRAIVLEAGGYTAIVVSVGAGLRLLSYQGRPLLSGYDADQLPPASRGIVLAPWPNRVGDGHYRFAETEYQLPITEVARGNAMHGLAFPIEWRVVDQSESSAQLVLRLQPTRGYPFRLDLQIAYEVSEEGCGSRCRPPRGVSDAPYGAARTHTSPRARRRSTTPSWSSLTSIGSSRPADAAVDRLPVAGTPYEFSAPRHW